jgi:nitroreductase/NAD-dependent dihydropyrimidine dehydrogenase PreA subunit
MSLFVIDPSKCNKDHICSAVCPLGIIEAGEKNTVPAPTWDAEELCVNCGHCVAACPTGALSHRAMTPEQCTPIKKDLWLTPDQAEQLLRGRRSIRTYRPEPVDRALLTRVVSLASTGPSGHNTQPVEWIVIHDSAEVKRLAGIVIDWMRSMVKEKPDFAKKILLQHVIEKCEKGIDAVCRSAPHVVLTHAHKDNMMAQSACTIALSYLELAAQANGLGACWAGYFDVAARYWPPLQQALGLPAGHMSYGAMMIGYPKYKYYRIPLRKEARISWK